MNIVLQIILTNSCLGIFDICTFQHNTTVCFNLFQGFCQLVLPCLHIQCIVFVSISILMCNKVQGARFSQFFQDLICIRHTWNLYDNTVCTFLIHLSFCAVLLYTLLQLVSSIIHLICTW